MKTIRMERSGPVAVVLMDRGVTNPIGPVLVAELSQALHELSEDEETGAVVLSSANDKFFSIGLEIPRLLTLTRTEFGEFYHSFNQLCLDLYTMPKPTFAAITGHATAGGCILALCCDHRFIAEGRKLMGLNEIKLGVPIPYPAASILRETVGASRFTTIVESGDLYPPEELLQLGLVERVLPIADLRQAGIEAAGRLATESSRAFQAIKRTRVEVVEERVARRLEEKEQIFIDAWCSPATQASLVEAAKKF